MPEARKLRKKIVVFLAIGLVALVLLSRLARTRAAANNSPPEPGEIDVRPDQAQGGISPLIYGMGLEWVENGNRILDPGSCAPKS
jgi:hypothetical protein